MTTEPFHYETKEVIVEKPLNPVRYELDFASYWDAMRLVEEAMKTDDIKTANDNAAAILLYLNRAELQKPKAQ